MTGPDGLNPVPFSGLITMLAQSPTRAERAWTEEDMVAMDRAIMWAREVMARPDETIQPNMFEED